jgi:magnesium transporter
MKPPANDAPPRPAPGSRYQLGAVRRLLHRGARGNIANMFARIHPVDAAHLFSSLTPAEGARLLDTLIQESGPARVASILTEMDGPDAVAILVGQPPDAIAHLLSEMQSDDATLLASLLPEPLAADVLSRMEKEAGEDVRALLEHEERTAGRLMTTEFFSLPQETTVAEAVAALHKRAEDAETVLYLYVVDAAERLVGVVSMRQLLIRPPSEQLATVMVPDAIRATTETPQEEVAELISEYGLLAVPVVDQDEKLVGIVTVDDIIDVVEEEAGRELLGLSGVSPEESPETPARRSLRLRAPWLLVNLGTASVAAMIISRFQGTIEALPLLAALGPIVAGVGGNGATQTLAVIVRALALGEVGRVPRTVLKEGLIGLGLGAVTGLVIAGGVALTSGRPVLGAVVGTALLLNLMIAGLMGSSVPILLKRLGFDPAVASGVFVTACTDMSGYFTFLGLSALLLRSMQG